MDISNLRVPFQAKDLDWRVGMCGLKSDGKPWAMLLTYIDARAVMRRLDEICGPENWKDEYKHVPGGIECTLSIRFSRKLPGHIEANVTEWVGKVDASPETKVEALKGGYSKALVRCSVKWGVGRYLYDLPTIYANIVDRGTKGANFAKGKDKKNNKDFTFYWLPPTGLK